MYSTASLLKDVRTHSAITAVDCVNEIRKQTNFDELLTRARVRPEEFVKACETSEEASESGVALKAAVDEAFDRTSNALASQGMPIVHGNIISRCTPLAAEFISLALDPQFGKEFEAFAKEGPVPTDLSRFSRDPIRPLSELVSAFMDTVADRATGDVRERLHEGSKLVRRKLR